MNIEETKTQVTDSETEKKIKIAYIIPRFHPFKGGAEQNFYALATRMVEQGHEVTVLTTDIKYRSEAMPKEEVFKGMKIIRHHALNESLYAGFYPELLSYLWRNEFDVIHSSGIGFLWREFCLIIKKFKVRKKTKFIVTPHGGFMVLNDSGGIRGFAKKYYTIGLKLFLNRLYDAVIQVNPKQKKWMNEDYGIDKEKIYLVPNGIDQSYLESRLVKHESNEKIIITYMNRMEWYKGVQDVIKALDSLLRSDRYKKNNEENHISLPEFEFYVMGRAGSYTPKLKELVERLKMEQYVKFIYSPSDEERDRIFYEESQINILPSKYENYGITLIESMAKGNAIITTYGNEGAYMFLKEGVNGFIYNFGEIDTLSDILFKLLSGYELRQEMRKYNLKYASEFTWETVFPDYLKLINDLLQ